MSEVSEMDLDTILSKYKRQPDSLIRALQQIQETIGFLPKGVQKRVAEALGVPPSKVYGVVSFYNLFTMVPRGRHTINVCLGTSCYVRGGKKVKDALTSQLGVDEGGTTKDLRFSLGVVRCLGSCALAPVIKIDSDVYSHVTASRLSQILAQYE